MSSTRTASSVDVRPAEVWKAGRGPVLVVGIVLAAGLVIALLGTGGNRGALDPRSASPSGSRALATLLEAQGVRVDRVTTTSAAVAAAGADATVLVVVPDLLDDDQAAALRATSSDLVLLAPSEPELFDRSLEAVRASDLGRRQVDCALPAARAAGDVDAGGLEYRVSVGAGIDADLCFSRGGNPSLVQVRRSGRAVTVLGNPDPLTNDRLDNRGNAALTMDLLGAHPRLVWYLPTLSDPGAAPGQSSLTELIPDGVWWALVQVAVAVVLIAFWRGRRLGPVVTEPLPVVVRAAEAVEGRGRLYRRAKARDRAADALRSGLLARVGPGLGLPRSTTPIAVVDAVAARTGRSPADTDALIFGPVPPDDDALVRLADELDRLEREVRRP